MNNDRLSAGDEIQCPNCRRWHAVHRAAHQVPAYLHHHSMLYFTCRGGEYYAGDEIGGTRHPHRKATPAPDVQPGA